MKQAEKLTGQKQTSTSLKDESSIARKKAYISCIEKYPLYSILLVLEEYTNKEWYEECAIIKKALDEYNSTKVKNKIDEHIIFPTHLSVYKGEKFQKTLSQYNIVVEEKLAKEKATLIKFKLPVK